jgi:hypothetical protein
MKRTAIMIFVLVTGISVAAFGQSKPAQATPSEDTA